MLVLPVVLLLSALRSLQELNETKGVYLRNRTADLAARLENLSQQQIDGDLFDLLAAEEPALLDLRVYQSPADDTQDPTLAALWRGEALFHTELRRDDAGEIFRAYIPFHREGALRIARMDLASDSAEFLVEHTRHHLALSILASVALIAFAGYFVWVERRATRMQRRQLEMEHLAQLGEMSAVLAHEIRNPLGTIKGFVQLTLESAEDSVSGLLSPVLEEVARLERLVSDLLLYGRPRKPEVRLCSWPELAARVGRHVQEQIGDRPIQYSAGGDLEQLTTDPEILEQVLLNLTRNAIEAVDEQSGRTWVIANHLKDGTARITVEDNGPGLPVEVRSRLFEPFTTTKSNGTGLGLSIARKLTEALGGSIEIRPGVPTGTCAELRFPG
jgi:two-component system sensor histidine kinase HydH